MGRTQRRKVNPLAFKSRKRITSQKKGFERICCLSASASENLVKSKFLLKTNIKKSREKFYNCLNPSVTRLCLQKLERIFRLLSLHSKIKLYQIYEIVNKQ